MRVWIDLTNSPHVLVMRPVIELLRNDGHEVQVTARDYAQTLQLLDRFGLDHTAIGRHRGERLASKAAGLLDRSLALRRWAQAQARAHGRFDLALGHGSNDVTVAARLLGIPCATMFDYEWASVQHHVNCHLAQAVVVPDAIPPERLYRYGARGKLRRYEGLKEEYYLADFEADDAVLGELALDRSKPIVVVRTPPEVSLYHRFENDLFAQVLERLRLACAPAPPREHGSLPRQHGSPPREHGSLPCEHGSSAGEPVQAVVLPRTERQREELGRIPGFTVPQRAIDAQSLVAFADLVVSAGGTMNREAVALGTPVYTTFEGRLGAVDERLIAEGRLRKLHSAQELPLGRRDPGAAQAHMRRDPSTLVDLLLSTVRS